MSWQYDRDRQQQKERIAKINVSTAEARERERQAFGIGKKENRKRRWTNIGTSNPMNIITIILVILLGACVIAVLMGREVRTVAGLLEALQNAPDIPIEDIISSMKGIPLLRGDWGIVDGLRSGINTIIESINTVYTTLAWLCMTMANFGLLVIWVLKWLFL